MRTIGLQWIEHRGGTAARIVAVQTPLVEYPGGQERRGQHLNEPRQRQRFTDRTAALLAWCQAAARGRRRQHRGNSVEALQSQHLFDEVRGRDDIGTPTRRRDGQYVRTRVGGHPCTDLRESVHCRAIRVDHPGRPIRKVDGHPHRRRREILSRRVTAPVGERGTRCATGDFGQQSRGAVDSRNRNGGVHPAFIAAAGLTDQMQPTDRARYRGRIPDRGFEQYVSGVRVDLGAARAHHAADRGDGHIVDDQHVAGFQCAVDAVEGDHPLPRLGEPHREVAVDPTAVVGVHGVTEFKHDVVGHVDGRRDRPDATEHEPPTQPPR